MSKKDNNKGFSAKNNASKKEEPVKEVENIVPETEEVVPENVETEEEVVPENVETEVEITPENVENEPEIAPENVKNEPSDAVAEVAEIEKELGELSQMKELGKEEIIEKAEALLEKTKAVEKDLEEKVEASHMKKAATFEQVFGYSWNGYNYME